MNVINDDLSKLNYSNIYALVVFKQCQTQNGALFYEPILQTKKCALLDVEDNYVVPCFCRICKPPSGIEFPIYQYETIKVSIGYGTYNEVPKKINKDTLGQFNRIMNQTYVFEGYFSSYDDLVETFNSQLINDVNSLAKTDNFIDANVMQKLQKISLDIHV